MENGSLMKDLRSWMLIWKHHMTTQFCMAKHYPGCLAPEGSLTWLQLSDGLDSHASPLVLVSPVLLCFVLCTKPGSDMVTYAYAAADTATCKDAGGLWNSH